MFFSPGTLWMKEFKYVLKFIRESNNFPHKRLQNSVLTTDTVLLLIWKSCWQRFRWTQVCCMFRKNVRSWRRRKRGNFKPSAKKVVGSEMKFDMLKGRTPNVKRKVKSFSWKYTASYALHLILKWLSSEVICLVLGFANLLWCLYE